MSKRGVKRKAGLHLDPDESDDIFVKEYSPKRNKPKHKDKRLSRLEEYDEDEGREGSRNFQKWAEIFETNTKGEVMKSKAFLKNFKVQVGKHTDRVRGYMREQEKKLTESKGQFAEVFEKLHFAKVLAPRTSNKVGSNVRAATKEGHILFKEAQSVISGGFSLLKQFKETDAQLKTFKLELPTSKWKQDKQDIKELLACGREVGEKLVEEKLAPKAYPSPQPDRYKANEKENIAAELFKESRKPTNGDYWGAVAADQVKRIAAIAKTVPVKSSKRERERR
ncbi:hypothetical protein F5Y05DRAFT_411748 [Hypoxylon sp. FL0543]|nr:hypothetical protein F5Y05DRAFT_411748 [Hypoxylon sp. FL0543]